jgi:ABC-type dipeptide/oligopeptide/nickel transport system ATPase component
LEFPNLAGVSTTIRIRFSGGMRQRTMIALALALDPKLIIADVPTTALDVTVQAQITDLLKRLRNDFGTAVIMITHDLGVIANMADEVIVMYAGRAVEQAERRAIYYRPHHPYTLGLLRSLPKLGVGNERLVPIPGQPPSLSTRRPDAHSTPAAPSQWTDATPMSRTFGGWEKWRSVAIGRRAGYRPIL